MNDEITPAGLNGVTEPGNKRPYFTGDDSFTNPQIQYEYYHINDDGDRDDFEAAEYANIYDWNKTIALNRWNAPAEQVKRLEEAGLNPLFYLGGNAGTTPAANAGPANAPNLHHSNNKMQNLINAVELASGSLLNSQKQALDYDIARRQQQIDLRRVGLEDRQTAVMEKQLGINADKTRQEIAESQSRVEVNGATIEQIAKQNSWTEQQIAESKAREAVLNKQVDEVLAKISNLKADTNLKNITASRIRQLIPLEVENLAAMTNLTVWQTSTEVEKMFNFSMDTDLKEVQIDLGREQKILVQRQADGQLKTNLILDADADWRDAEHQMQVVTGYWNAVNGSIQAVGTTVGAASNFIGPKAAFYKGAAQNGMFQNHTVVNPFSNYHSSWPSNQTVWPDTTPVPPGSY